MYWVRRHGAWVALVVLAGFVWGCALNPVTGQRELVLMSESQEIALGSRLYPRAIQLMQGLPACDPELQRYVQRVGLRLARASHRPALPWRFCVVNSSQPNAFALPGGKVAVTRGLITRLNNEAQLAFVLGHEVGHVAARHQVQAYTRRVLFTLALAGIAAAAGDSGWARPVLVGAGLAGMFLLLSFSRDQERQADELGYEYMTRCGYNPRAMVGVMQIFKRLERKEPGLVAQLFRTHPLTSERLRIARERAAFSPRSRGLWTERFRRALALQKDRAPAYAAMDKADKFAGRRRYTQAIRWYSKAVGLFPREGLFHTRLARVLLRMGRPADALKQALVGRRLASGWFRPPLVAGISCARMGRYYRALAYLHEADRLLPDYQPTKWAIARVYDTLGLKAKAVEYYEQTLRLSPATPVGRAAARRLRQLKQP